jgi:magnesium chelatase family protein
MFLWLQRRRDRALQVHTLQARAISKPDLRSAARSLRSARRLNARLDARALWRVVKLGAEQRALLKRAADRWQLSARGSLRVLKVARTIADLEQSGTVTTQHVAEALQLRCRERA